MTDSFTWIDREAINETRFECYVCFDILDDPKECHGCNRALCGGCYAQTKSTVCPHCKRKGTVQHFNLHLRDEWSAFPIQCDACEMKMSRGKWESHRDGSCEFPCKDCGTKITRKMQAKHVAETCPQAVVTCPAQVELVRLGVGDAEGYACRVKVKRKDLALHKCQAMPVLPLLNQIQFRGIAHWDWNLAHISIWVGKQIDYRFNEYDPWTTATIQTIREDRKVATVLRADNGNTELSSISSKYMKELYTHTPRPAPVETAPEVIVEPPVEAKAPEPASPVVPAAPAADAMKQLSELEVGEEYEYIGNVYTVVKRTPTFVYRIQASRYATVNGLRIEGSMRVRSLGKSSGAFLHNFIHWTARVGMLVQHVNGTKYLLVPRMVVGTGFLEFREYQRTRNRFMCVDNRRVTDRFWDDIRPV